MSGQDRFVFAPRIGQSGLAMYRVQDVEIKTTYDAVQAIVAEKAAAYEAATAAATEITAGIAAKAVVIATKQAQVAVLVAGVPVNASSVATMYSELTALQSARTDLQAQYATVSATLATRTAAVVAKQAEIATLAAQPGNNTAAMSVLVAALAVLTQAQSNSQSELAALTLEVAAKDSAVLAKQAQIDASSAAAGFDPAKIATMIVQTTVLETLNDTHAALLLQSTDVNTLLTANARAILSKQAQIGILQSKPGDNASAISALQVELASLQASRVSLETQAAQIAADLATNNAAITAQQSSINALAAQAGANSAAIALIAVKKIASDALAVETAVLQESKLDFDDVTTQLQAVVAVAATPPTNVEWSPELDGELSAVPRLGTIFADLARATLADRYAIVAGAIPEGTTFTTEGQLSGTATTAQDAAWTVRAGTNFPTQYSDKLFTLHVAPEILWQTTTLPVLELQQAGQTRPLIATNASFYAVVAGVTPPGTYLSGTGILLGTPTSHGTSSFTVRATSDHPDIYIERSFSQQVVATPVWSTPEALTDVAKSETYSFQLVAPTIDGVTTFEVHSGTLPTGLAMGSSGLLTGTPSVASTVSWTVRATGVNAFADRTFTLLVANRPAWTTAAALANTSQSVLYTTTLVATNGFAPGFSVVSGAVPAGASLSDGGVLSGTPTAVATYTFTVRSLSTTSAIIYADRTFTQTTVPLPIWVSAGGAYTDVPQGVAITSVQLSATYGVSYALSSGALPTGISLSPGGLLSGTPTVSGSYSWTVRVTGSATNATADRSFTQLIATIPAWSTSPSLPNTAQNIAYSTTVSASPANPNGYSLVGGSLPVGSLNAQGTYSGTPPTLATYNFTVRVLSSTSNIIYSDRSFSQTVSPVPSWNTDQTTFSSVVVANTGYSRSLSAPNATGFSLVSGSFPPGLSVSGSSLTGTPNSAGNYNFTIRALGAASNGYADRGFSQTVAATPSWNTGTGLGDYAQGAGLTFNLNASNTGSYGHVGGSYPGGMSFNSSGTLSGNPNVSGSFSFTIRAYSPYAGSVYSDRTFDMRVGLTPSWNTGTNFGTVTINTGVTLNFSASNAGSYAFAGGSYPSGMTFSGSQFTGTPSNAGSFSFTIRAYSTVTTNVYADRTFSLTVQNIPVTWNTGTNLGSYQQGSAYNIALSATNATSYALVGGTLPSGLNVNGGSLQGTVTNSGSFSFTIRATGVSSSADQTFTMTVIGINIIEYLMNPSPQYGTIQGPWTGSFGRSPSGYYSNAAGNNWIGGSAYDTITTTGTISSGYAQVKYNVGVVRTSFTWPNANIDQPNDVTVCGSNTASSGSWVQLGTRQATGTSGSTTLNFSTTGSYSYYRVCVRTTIGATQQGTLYCQGFSFA